MMFLKLDQKVDPEEIYIGRGGGGGFGGFGRVKWTSF